jgi:hypothetical protein
MKIVRFLLPVLTLGLGLVLTTTRSDATIEYSKKEKKPCTTCHVKAASKELNDAGKYYKAKKTLEGYKKK